MADEPVLDALDLALLTALQLSPRAGILELSRSVKVARATVQSRLERMERSGVITGYGPDIDIAAAGYPVQAFVTLEIAQGSLDKLHQDLSSIPGVLEAYATTGTGDVLCRVAAASNAELQQTLLQLNGLCLGGPVHQRGTAFHRGGAAGHAAAVVEAAPVVHPGPGVPRTGGLTGPGG